MLTQITTRPDSDEWRDLQPGQMLRVPARQDIWIICCPRCGNLGELRTHQVGEHDDGTVTVSPSLVCHGSISGAPHNYTDCRAHYFIRCSRIEWCPE